MKRKEALLREDEAPAPASRTKPGARALTERLPRRTGGTAPARDPTPAPSHAPRDPTLSSASFVENLLTMSAPPPDELPSMTGAATYASACEADELALESPDRTLGFTPLLDRLFEEHPAASLDELLALATHRPLPQDRGQHPSLAVEAGTRQGRKRRRGFAVYVANAAYPARPLDQTINDALALERRLIPKGYRTVGGGVQRDKTATEIEAAFQTGSGGELVAGDALVLYYSGHGTRDGLAGVDLNILPNPRVISMADQARGKGADVYVMVDACYSGTVVDEARGRHLDRLTSSRGDDPLVGLARDISQSRAIFDAEDTLIWDAARERELAARLAGHAARFEELAGRPMRTPPRPAIDRARAGDAGMLSRDLIPPRERLPASERNAWEQTIDNMTNEVLAHLEDAVGQRGSAAK